MKKHQTPGRQLELPMLADVNASTHQIREARDMTPCKYASSNSYRASAQDQSIYDEISASYFRSIARASTHESA